VCLYTYIYIYIHIQALLRKFISHVQELRPHVIVTYNGDFFDWPYVDKRCSKYADMSLYKHLGIQSISATGEATDAEYTGRCMVHLDAFCWVKRDSYLPQGTQGLKAVTKNKLGYDPVEVDPEDMLRYICIYMDMYLCVYIYMYVCMYIYIHVFMTQLK
jgi:DNA polymerase epsilon subunit 1